MNQFNQNPPSYDSVIASSPEQIGESTYSQPAVQNVYPVMPSAPPMHQPYPMPPSQKYPMPQPQPPPTQNYGTITVSEVIQTQPSINPVSDVTFIVGVNGCPICRIGVLEDDYSCLGICLAIFCFPIGILCCLACKNKRCSSCGAII